MPSIISKENRKRERLLKLILSQREEVDVVPLNMAVTFPEYEVYGKGKLLFCTDRAKFMDDKIKRYRRISRLLISL